MITSMGFSGYFLIVWDLIRFARENGIRVGPGRGSAAGSVVSYSLRITDLDPLRYDLIFERFLNPGRIQMPDIDMDFDERRRDEVIRYVASKYGSDRVAQIITFQTIKGKQGIRDAARVLGSPRASATASARCTRRRSWGATSRSRRRSSSRTSSVTPTSESPRPARSWTRHGRSRASGERTRSTRPGW